METLPWYIYLFAIFTGFVAGIMNTLAGNGSALTLPVLVLLGLPTGVANGTNRIGVLVQSLTGYLTFKKGGMSADTAAFKWLVIPAVAGSVAGAQKAVVLHEKFLNLALACLMLLLLYLTLKNPAQWLTTQQPNAHKLRNAKTLMLMFLVGIYGGFIQAGVGIIILTALVPFAGYSLTQANSIKSLLVLAFTIPALLVFILNGQVNWLLGLLLSVGQALGAWVAATFALRVARANVYIRYLLIAVIVFACVQFFYKFAV